MSESVFRIGDRVTITHGALSTMPGVIVSPEFVAGRWPNVPPSPAVERGEAFHVQVRVIGRDYPILLAPDWMVRSDS